MTADRRCLVCLTTSAAYGGAETSLITLLRAFRRLEPAWTIVVVAPTDGPVIDVCRRMGCGAVVLPYPPALAALGESGATGARRRSIDQLRMLADAVRVMVALPRYVAGLRRILRELDATVVHSNGLKAHVAAALAKPAGVRLVWHLHEYIRARPLTARLLRLLHRRADAMVANSDSVLDDARAVCSASTRLRRIYNAVDTAVFTPGGAALDLAALAGLPGDDQSIRVGLVATFGRWKGHDVFIDAIARLKDRSRVRAYVIGGPVYETSGSQWSLPELQRRVADRRLEETVGFTGPVADVAAALRALDIVVHASTQPEPFGMVIAEGMASARAVIAVNAGGARELFADRMNAIGVPPGDAAALAAAIDDLAADAHRRARLGEAARVAACEQFSPHRMAAEFKEVYLG